MSTTRKCDNCGLVGEWGEVQWVSLRDETTGDKHDLTFMPFVWGDRYDFCGWRCISDYSSLRAMELQFAPGAAQLEVQRPQRPATGLRTGVVDAAGLSYDMAQRLLDDLKADRARYDALPRWKQLWERLYTSVRLDWRGWIAGAAALLGITLLVFHHELPGILWLITAGLYRYSQWLHYR